MRVLYLDPNTFPPAALDDATTLKLRRYLLGTSMLSISGSFFIEAFTFATEQERRELAECANRWLYFDPSGDSVTVSAVPGDSVFVDGRYLRDGEKRKLVHGNRITLTITASVEISYDFFETPRAVTSPVESTRTNLDMALDTQTEDVGTKEEPPIPVVPTLMPMSLLRQAPGTPAPVEVATSTIAVPREDTAPVVPTCVAAPAPKRAVPLARDPLPSKESVTLALQNTHLPDPAAWSAPDEFPDLFEGGGNSDDDDEDDDQQEAQFAPVANDPPRSHRMPGLGPSLPVTASGPSQWAPQTLSVPKQRPTVDAPAPPRRPPTQHERTVASRTRSASALAPPMSPQRRRPTQKDRTVASRTRSASVLDTPSSPPGRNKRQHLVRRASTPVPQSPIPFLCTEKRCQKIATFETNKRMWKCQAHAPPPTPEPTPFTVLESVVV